MLRAVVFGVNDGLVSNFSLVMGVAGGTSNNSIVLLAGIAGLVAGAFSMASGEWISIRSQRELYENELRIEQRRAARVPRGGARRARDDLPGQGRHTRGRARRSSTTSCAAPTSRSTRSHARSSGSTRAKLGSPWVAAGSSFLAFAVGAVDPDHPVPLRQRYRGHHRRCGDLAARAVRAGAATSIFTGRHAGRAGLRMALIGAVVAAITFGIGSLVGTSV